MTHHPIRLSVALLAPLVLGGCGLPLGVQIASLFADAVSILTTEKTVTDHGLSLVAKKDCAVWRGLKGETICHEIDRGAVAVAEAGAPAEAPPVAAPAADTEAAAPSVAALARMDVATGGNQAVEETRAPLVESPIRPAGAGDTGLPGEAAAGLHVPGTVPGAGPDRSAAGQDGAPTRLGRPAPPGTASASGRAQARAKGGTFYIIASFRHLANAKRFAHRQSALASAVLAGTAKGRPVFRVAVGPIAKAELGNARASLVGAGFRDVWALTLKQPNVVFELAQLD